MRRCFPVTFRLSYRKALSLLLNPLRASLLWVAFAFGAEAQTVEGWQPSLAGFVDGLVTTTLDRDAVAGAVVVIVIRRQDHSIERLSAGGCKNREIDEG